VVATTDPGRLPGHSSWYLLTNLPHPASRRAQQANLAEVVRLDGLCNWVEQGYKQVAGRRGGAPLRAIAASGTDDRRRVLDRQAARAGPLHRAGGARPVHHDHAAADQFVGHHHIHDHQHDHPVDDRHDDTFDHDRAVRDHHHVDHHDGPDDHHPAALLPVATEGETPSTLRCRQGQTGRRRLGCTTPPYARPEIIGGEQC
jgi:hypothetical protein